MQIASQWHFKGEKLHNKRPLCLHPLVNRSCLCVTLTLNWVMGKRARHNQVAKQWRGCPEIRSPPRERAGKMCLWNRLHSPGPYPITTSLQRQGSRAQRGHPCGHSSQPPFLRLKEGLIKGSATRPTPGQTWTVCSSCLLLPTSSF